MSSASPPARAALRPRRSVLYMPGSNPRALAKARTLPVDGVILDLEDAVAPNAKEEARHRVAEALAEGGFGHRERVVRVNGLDTPWGAADLDAVAAMNLDAVLLPKIEGAGDVLAAWRRLCEAGARSGLALWVMIETPRGVLATASVCAAAAPLACVVLGTSDLAKELRVEHTPGRPGLLPALGHCVLAARAAGLDVLDGVQLDLEDEAALESVCRQGRELGFDGKTLIHPRQIATANRIFAPAPESVTAARRTLEAWEAASARGDGLAVVDGRLVEHLHAAEARRLVQMAEAIACREGGGPRDTGTVTEAGSR